MFRPPRQSQRDAGGRDGPHRIRLPPMDSFFSLAQAGSGKERIWEYTPRLGLTRRGSIWVACALI